MKLSGGLIFSSLKKETKCIGVIVGMKKGTGKKKTTRKKKTVRKNRIFHQKKHKKKQLHNLGSRTAIVITVLCLTGAFALLRFSIAGLWNSSLPKQGVENMLADAAEKEVLPKESGICGRPEIIKDYIEINEYSRSGIALKKVKGIVIHYVANPGSTAQENRDYFDGLKNTHATKASSHFVVGLDGEVIQCIPLDEISYASNQRNKDTISIECCHPDQSGKFNKNTYTSVVQLTAWLCDTYGLSSDDVIRHYDVTGKQCPLYYVKHENAWKELKNAVEQKLEGADEKEKK